MTSTYVGTRRNCARLVSQYAKSKETGVITDVRLTKLSFMVWHVEFKVDLSPMELNSL